MLLPGEQPSSEIIRPPETPEEKWTESIRMAASILELKSPLNRHQAKQEDATGVTKSPLFEANEWQDPDTGDHYNLRRYWSRTEESSDRWKAEYRLRVYSGVHDFDLHD